MKEEEVEEKKTAFHGALFYSERINEILKALNDLRLIEADNRNNRALVNVWQKRFALLNDFFAELYGKMDKDEKKEHKDGRDLVRTYWVNAKREYLMGRKTSSFFLELFDEWELELRALAEKKGLIMPDKEADSGL